jgi:hypothetical protein
MERLRGRAGGGSGESDGGQGSDQLGGHRGGERGRLSRGYCQRASGQAGQGPLPGGDAHAGQHAEPERERLAACVQGGMAQLLVAGIQPAAGGGGLAGFRAVARFSSRSAR